jgi:hypothetical protein
MSVYLDFNAKYTSGAFNAKDSFLYSSGVLNHIALSFLSSTINTTSTYGLGSISLPSGTTGTVILNGLVVVLDSSTQLLTGSVPTTSSPITLAITQQNNVPFFSYYPYGVVPSNYIKVATYLQGVSDWVYEPIIGPTLSLINNAWGYKTSHILNSSSTAMRLYGENGYIYTDSAFSLNNALPDSRCGISVTSTYPIVTGSGLSFTYSTQLILEPFNKSFLNVPINTNRSTPQSFSPVAPFVSSTSTTIVPGPIITSSGNNAESALVSYATGAANSWAVQAIYLNTVISSSQILAVTMLPGSSPVLVPSLDSYGAKWIYLNSGYQLMGYNIVLYSNGTRGYTALSQILLSGITPTSISAVSLGALTFILSQNVVSSTINLSTLVGSTTSTLWAPVTLTVPSITSTAQLIVDKQAIAHVLYISGTSLMSYNYPLGTGVPSGTTTYITNARYFSCAQNVLGDSIIVASDNVSSLYKSINMGPFTTVASGTNFGAISYVKLNADLSYFGLMVSSTTNVSGYYIEGIDGYEYKVLSTLSGTGNINPGSATLSPISVSNLNSGTVVIYPLQTMNIKLPSVLTYRYNSNAYPTPVSEIIYPNEINNEARINTALNVGGTLRPQTVSSTVQYILGDNGSWYQIKIGPDGTLYTSQ